MPGNYTLEFPLPVHPFSLHFKANGMQNYVANMTSFTLAVSLANGLFRLISPFDNENVSSTCHCFFNVLY